MSLRRNLGSHRPQRAPDQSHRPKLAPIPHQQASQGLTDLATRCQKLSASEAPRPGRRHIGIAGDIISEYPGDFVGIRSPLVWTMRFLTYLPHDDDVHALDHILQDKITTQIAGALAIRISQAEQERPFAKPTENLESGRSDAGLARSP